MNDLEPNIADARAYIEALTGSPESKVTFQTYDDTKMARGDLLRIIHGTLDECKDQLWERNQRKAAIHVTVNETDFKGRTKENIVAPRAVFIDCDGIDPKLALEPSFSVRSSHGPHHYWLLQPGESADESEIAGKQLATYYGSDRAVAEKARVLRLPGFYHNKGEPFLVKFVPGNGKRYTIAEILAAHPVSEKKVKAAAKARAAGGKVPIGERYNVLLKELGIARRWGAEEDELRAKAYRVAKDFQVAPDEDDASLAAGIDDVIRGIMTYEPAPLANFRPDDIWNGQRFAVVNRDRARYVDNMGAWFTWRDCLWKENSHTSLEAIAKYTVTELWEHVIEFNDPPPIRGAAPSPRDVFTKWVGTCSKMNKIQDMITSARSEPTIQASPDDFDADRWALNCKNGVVDLRTGELRPHSSEEMITKVVPINYDPDAKAPRWMRFLEEIMADKESARVKILVDFLQRAVGYTLTGDVSEQVMFILHGSGANGKGTFTRALKLIFGDSDMDGYGRKFSIEMILDSVFEKRPYELAKLRGVRYAFTQEGNEDAKLDESKVKEITGGDELSAREIYGHPFTFMPQFKIWVATNNKPEIAGTDYAIWRRLILIPFTVKFEKSQWDLQLEDKLKAEAPGILAWAVQGAIEWHRRRRAKEGDRSIQTLDAPDEVIEATAAYRSEEDKISAFLDDECVLEASARCGSSELYAKYQDWCKRTGEARNKAGGMGLTQRSFGLRLGDKGIGTFKSDGRKLRLGIRLRTTDDGPRYDAGSDEDEA